MTAPRHAVAVPHPCLKNAIQLAGDLWFLAVEGWKFLWRHMFGVLMTAVAGTFVTVLTFTLVIAGFEVAAVFVMLVGVFAITAGVAVKAMGDTK